MSLRTWMCKQRPRRDWIAPGAALLPANQAGNAFYSRKITILTGWSPGIGPRDIQQHAYTEGPCALEYRRIVVDKQRCFGIETLDFV